MTFISVLILSLFLTVVLTPIFTRLAVKVNAYDMPDARKVHQLPVPRIGGLAMAIGTFIPVLIWSPLDASVRAYLTGAAIIVIFGLIDDLKGLDFKIKFAGQIAAALVAVLYGGVKIISLGSLLPDDMFLANWVAIILTVVAIVGVTNAINLADGLDGLAGGISLLSFLCIGYLAFMEQDINIAITAAALSGAIFGFLRFNTYPATLFMGDTGSQLLGFSAAFLAFSLTQGNTALSPLLPLIILGFPVLDTITVMCERIAGGRSPFTPDKKHFHHRLMRMGLFHTEAVFVIYVIQAFLIISAYVFRFHSEWLLLTGYLAFSGLIISAIYVTRIKGWTLRRFDFVDRNIKGRLRVLRERGFFIKMAFKPVELGAPLFLIMISFFSTEIPLYFAVLSAAVAALFGLVWFLRRDWAKGFLMLLLYLFIPILIYLSDTHMVTWMTNYLMNLYNISFLLLAALCFITLRLTRRKKGFKVTPMDFLVLFITMGLVALPDLRAQFGAMAMKTIVLFFTYEIVLGEVRDKVGKVALLTVTAFVIVAVRGVVG
jgi:UDP-GlcNAc:undecaprenyl-phosphate GlcNAc-1-phosphate transferase